MGVEILPAILSKNSGDYHRKLKAIEPLTEWVQIDIVDNQYAPNQTIDAKVIASIRTRLKLEIHLMVEHIENWIDPILEIRPSRIVFPLESAREPILLVRHMRQHNIPFGFSIEPGTRVESLQHLVDKIDLVLLLAVHPGFSGQHFAFSVLEKIRKLKEMRPDLLVEVDGGMEPGTAYKCARVGANILAAGSFIFDNVKMEGDTYNEKVRNAYYVLKESVADVLPETSV
jgi:ribulose-phosphate 3-epimerase